MVPWDYQHGVDGALASGSSGAQHRVNGISGKKTEDHQISACQKLISRFLVARKTGRGMPGKQEGFHGPSVLMGLRGWLDRVQGWMFSGGQKWVPDNLGQGPP